MITRGPKKIRLPYFGIYDKTITPKKDIFNYKLRQKPYRELYYKLKNIYLSYMYKKFFNPWMEYTTKRKMLRRKAQQLQEKNIVMRKHFAVWKNLYCAKHDMRNKLENLVLILNRLPNQLFFSNLVHLVIDETEELIKEEEALLFYVRNLKYKTFFGWMFMAKKLAEKRRNYDLALSTYFGSLMRKGIITLSEYTRYRINKRFETQRAVMNYAYQIIRR